MIESWRATEYREGGALSYSFLDLAYDVLKQTSTPMTYQEIWGAGKDSGLAAKIKTSGKTPWQSLGARLYVDVRDNEASQSIALGKRPVRFFLKERQAALPQDALGRIEREEAREGGKAPQYREAELHCVLAYYAYANPTFNKGRPIVTKTIHHETSRKSGYSEWVYPDMVGFYMPLDDWKPDVVDFNRISENNSLRLFSFEIKRVLNKSNYREAFFQAVSNSSWAHQGYLVAAEIPKDDELLSELDRLASSFGIGIIHLDLSDFDASPVICPARVRDVLDWETMNKLCDQNPDFEKFLQDVKIDFESKRVHRAEYDDVVKDIDRYIQERLKTGQ